MGRTTVDVDDDLVGRVVRRHGSRTEEDAVDSAPRQVAAAPMTSREMQAVRGSGWDGDLDAVRGSEAEECAGQGRAEPAPPG